MPCLQQPIDRPIKPKLILNCCGPVGFVSAPVAQLQERRQQEIKTQPLNEKHLRFNTQRKKQTLVSEHDALTEARGRVRSISFPACTPSLRGLLPCGHSSVNPPYGWQGPLIRPLTLRSILWGSGIKEPFLFSPLLPPPSIPFPPTTCVLTGCLPTLLLTHLPIFLSATSG